MPVARSGFQALVNAVWGAASKIVTSVSGNVGGNVNGNVVGSVASVTAPVSIAAGSRGTILRRITGATTITDTNSSETSSLGVTVVEANCSLHLNGFTVSGNTDYTAAVELPNANNVQVRRSSSSNTTVVYWELREMNG